MIFNDVLYYCIQDLFKIVHSKTEQKKLYILQGYLSTPGGLKCTKGKIATADSFSIKYVSLVQIRIEEAISAYRDTAIICNFLYLHNYGHKKCHVKS